MDYLWFLGYQLDDVIPNHSVLSKARSRWGVSLFRRVFMETLQRCMDAGFVSADKIHIDSSLIDANASRKSIEKEVLLKVVSVEEAKLEEQTTSPSEEEKKPPKPKRRSRTDADAAVVAVRGQGPARARYKHHRAVDDQKGVITAISTTPGDVNEGHMFKSIVDQHQFNTSTVLHTAVADCQYGTNENYRICDECGIQAHLGDFRSKHKHSGVVDDVFKLEQFTYDAEHDVWLCPAGKRLHRESYSPKRRRTDYRAKLQDCSTCVLKSQCTKATKAGRCLSVPDNWQGIERARGQAHSRSAKEDRVRRHWLGEGSFADASNNHGFKRSRWRGLWRQQIQDYLIAAVQNMRILIRSSAQNRPASSMCSRYLAPGALSDMLLKAVIRLIRLLEAPKAQFSLFLLRNQ